MKAQIARLLGCIGVLVSLSGALADERLNFVVIFMDDMGYADPGCFGGAAGLTPNIDRLATEGMRFTNFLVSQAVCSASRAALLTGCHAVRVGVLGALPPNAPKGLAPEEETIADVLKKLGYVSAMIGKWHLGDRPPWLPLQQGFDEFFGLPYSNDMWPVDFDGTPIPPEGQPWPPKDGRPHRPRYPPLYLMEGNEQVREIRTLSDQNELTRLYTERAVRFIEQNRQRPFFLYLAHSMVHVPLAVSDRFRGRSGRGLYGDVLMEVDWSVGEIVAALRRNALERRTLLVLTSDNGPWLNYGDHAGQARPLREGKGTSWEGGARVPCIAWWPGRVPAGTVCDRLAATIDLLPTFATLAGAPLPNRKLDGVDISPLLFGQPDAEPRTEYWYYYGRTLTAVRWRNWKLMLPHESRTYEGFEPGRGGLPGPTGMRQVPQALYDLDRDVGETTDVQDRHPEIVERLRSIAAAARAELGDEPSRPAGGRASRSQAEAPPSPPNRR
ncbi:MAG: sulfatase [Kiritimatiellae bacterium]|nr:sulfatase [Kiritimatiellia bacterium]